MRICLRRERERDPPPGQQKEVTQEVWQIEAWKPSIFSLLTNHLFKPVVFSVSLLCLMCFNTLLRTSTSARVPLSSTS